MSLITAYGVGSLSTAVLVCRGLGLPDPRTQGSGNPGATNVLRTAGRWAGLATLVGDVGKGFAALWLAETLGIEKRLEGLVYVAVLLGHLFPVFFRFRGGKGVAVGWGALLYMDLWVALSVFVVWIIALLIGRRVWLASSLAALSSPFWMHWQGAPVAWLYAAVFAAILVVLRHRANWLDNPLSLSNRRP